MLYRLLATFALCCICLPAGCSLGRAATPDETTPAPTVTSAVNERVTPSAPVSLNAVSTEGVGEMEALEACILGHWTHSHEEDTPDAMIYRPASYSFPPSRGRMGLEFRSGGDLVYYGIARAD